jgi:hypothetical protein
MAGEAGGASGRRLGENRGRLRVSDRRSSRTSAIGLPETAGDSVSVTASGIVRTNAVLVALTLAIGARAVEPWSAATAATTNSRRHDARSIGYDLVMAAAT